jgi:heptosyltransferase-2
MMTKAMTAKAAMTTPDRVLVVMPSWVGDVVMATPALRHLREALPSSRITAMVRPGLDDLLLGAGLVNDFVLADARGLFGPLHVARSLEAHRIDAALLLTNSFSTALTVRLSNIAKRVGFDRDWRRPLLTQPLRVPREGSGFAMVPAVAYYMHAARSFLGPMPDLPAPIMSSLTHAPLDLPPDSRLELGLSAEQKQAAAELLTRAGLEAGSPYAILNPGGNNPAKRWPADRFAVLADHLAATHGLAIVINGSPAEAALVRSIADAANTPCIALPECGITLGTLKGVIARARLMVTCDTGPRHIAAAFGVPLVSLFGPTDPRWTTIPVRTLLDGRPSETILIANTELALTRQSNDDPQGSRIERIETAAVCAAADRLLETR